MFLCKFKYLFIQSSAEGTLRVQHTSCLVSVQPKNSIYLSLMCEWSWKIFILILNIKRQDKNKTDNVRSLHHSSCLRWSSGDFFEITLSLHTKALLTCVVRTLQCSQCDSPLPHFLLTTVREPQSTTWIKAYWEPWPLQIRRQIEGMKTWRLHHH